jgi:beta-glucanase (GH16 family)
MKMPLAKGMVMTWIWKTSTNNDHFGDEIDYEWVTGGDAKETQTNYFVDGVISHENGFPAFMEGENQVVDQFHNYTMNYEPNKLEWLIDGKVVRSVAKGDKPFPKNEGRLFASIWDTCKEAPGTQTWAHGPSAWCSPSASAEAKKQEYQLAIDFIEVQCHPGYGKTEMLAKPKPDAAKDGANKKTSPGAKDDPEAKISAGPALASSMGPVMALAGLAALM